MAVTLPQAVPNRGTSEQHLDAFNRAMRGSDVYQNFMRRNGLSTDGRVRLSRGQQAALERELAAAGAPISGGMHIDQGGNLNQKNRTGRNAAIAAAIAAGTATGFGLAGMGPLSGLGGTAAAGAGGMSAGLPAGMLPGGAMMSTTFPAAAGMGATAAAGGVLPSTSLAASGLAPYSAASAPMVSASGGGMNLGSLLSKIGSMGRLAGNAAQGASNQRFNENSQRLTQANLANIDALNRANFALRQSQGNADIDLQRKLFSQQEPNAQARQALVGSLLSRLQPVSLSGLSDRVKIPTLNNSIIDALGPEARQAGSLLADRGVSGLQRGPTPFDALPNIEVAPYQQSDSRNAGLLERILGGVGLTGSMVGAFGPSPRLDDEEGG